MHIRIVLQIFEEKDFFNLQAHQKRGGFLFLVEKLKSVDGTVIKACTTIVRMAFVEGSV